MASSFDAACYLGRPIGDLLEALPPDDPTAADAGLDLLVDRTIQLLRRGSSDELGADSRALNRHLDRLAGAAWKVTEPARHAAWSIVARVLSQAARRRDVAAIDAVLRSHKGKAQRVIELLAENGGSLARADLLRRLDVEDSHLSHILRDLEEADLVRRFREGGRNVIVELDWAGRDAVETKLVPAWLEFFLDHCDLVRAGDTSALAPEDLSAKLRELHAPSEIVIERLLEELGTRSADEVERQARFVEEVDRECHGRLSAGRQRERRPGALFSLVA